MSSMSCSFVWFSILTNGAHYKLMLTKSKRMPMRTALYISTYFTILFLVQVVDLFLHYLDVCGFDVSTNRNYPWIWYALMKLNNIFIFHHSKLVHIYIYLDNYFTGMATEYHWLLLKVSNNNVLSKKTCFYKLDNNTA